MHEEEATKTASPWKHDATCCGINNQQCELENLT